MNNEEQLAKELSRFFRRLKKEVLAALEEYWSDYQMLQGHINLICAPVHEAHKEYYEILEKYIKKEYKLGRQEATRLVNKAGVRYAFKSETITMPIAGIIKRDNDLFGTLPKAESDLLNRTYRTSERTLSRVDGQINQIITDGYRSGKGINDISNQLTRRFDQLETWEAKRIARTEVNTSHNKATVDTYNDLGVEYTQWIAADDDRTRDSHLEVDGEIIPLGGKYSNGLSYPGDMSGPIEEWINCRCSNAPFVIPYGFIAPSFSPFREEDLIKIEDIQNKTEFEDISEPQNIKENLKIPYEINPNESNSSIKITPEVLETVLNHKTKRANAKIEWGNLVELDTGKLTHSKDIRGSRNKVTVPRTTNKPFGLLHNHPTESAFSGADLYNELVWKKEQACFATTKGGLWLARDTEHATFMKNQHGGIPDSISAGVRSKLNGKLREISRDLMDNKYNSLILHTKSEEQRKLLKAEHREEVMKEYTSWLLEEYGVGKRSDNLIEIEFISNEELKNVKF